MNNMNDSLSFNVNLNNFNGPLEVLLDLAKSQKVDLEKISITTLVDQFLDFIKSTDNIGGKSIGALVINGKLIAVITIIME